MKNKLISSVVALSPLMLFVCLFIGTGIYLTLKSEQNAFYQVSPSVLILPAIILSLILSRFWFGRSFQKSLIFFQRVLEIIILSPCV